MLAEQILTGSLLDKVLEYLQGLIWAGFWLGVMASAIVGVGLLICGMGVGMTTRRDK